MAHVDGDALAAAGALPPDLGSGQPGRGNRRLGRGADPEGRGQRGVGAGERDIGKRLRLAPCGEPEVPQDLHGGSAGTAGLIRGHGGDTLLYGFVTNARMSALRPVSLVLMA